MALNVMVLELAALNAYLHWRILTGRSLTWHNVLSASAADLVLITLAILITNGRNLLNRIRYPKRFAPHTYISP